MKMFFSVLVLVSGLKSYAQVEIKIPLTVGNFKATAKDVTGNVKQLGKDKFAAENIVVDLTTITTGIDLRDEHLKEKLEVTKYPTAKLIKATGENGKGTADLEIHGQKVSVKGTYEVVGKNLVAVFPVELDKVGIAGINYKGMGVKNKVEVTVTRPIEAGAAPAAAPAKK